MAIQDFLEYQVRREKRGLKAPQESEDIVVQRVSLDSKDHRGSRVYLERE